MKFAGLLFSRLGVKNVPGARRLATLSDELRSRFSAFKGGTVQLTKDDHTGIAEVYFSNPTKRNSFSGHMMLQLHDVVTELRSWKEGKGLVFYGGDGVFCSGGDLDMMKALNTPELGAQMATIMHSALMGLRELPLISVALIQGRALGGGAELTTACDFRIIVPGAEIQFVQVRMGLVPGWGGTTRLVRLLGAHEALKLLSSGRKVGAEEALELGLVDHILQNYESPLAEARKWLGQYIACDTHVIRVCRGNPGSCSGDGMPLVSEEFRVKLNSLKSSGRIELVEDVNGIARLSINDPAKRNCISGEMMLELANAVRTLEHWPHIKAVLLYGEGPFFCSGANLVSMKGIPSPDEGRQMSALMQDTLTRFSNLPMISAVLIEGRAIGGGAELTTAADFRIMAPDSEVQFVHVRMGITSAWGGMSRLTQIVGPTLTLDLFSSGRPLRPDEAVRTGFASHILSGQRDAKEEALEWLREQTKGPVEIMQAVKLGMVAARSLPLQEALQRENDLFASVWGRDAHSDALRQNVKH
nr:ethylmalonyl-CoA decarboxylase-like [Dermacentor andersoni]